MELKSIRQKGENIRVIGEITALYKYDGTVLTTEVIPVYDGVGHVLNYNEDVYLFVEQDTYFDVLRIGKPPEAMILKDTESRRFNQYDTAGNLTGFVDSVEVGNGYWKVVPLVIGKGYFELDGLYKPFDFGYENSTGGGTCPASVKLQSNVWQLIALPVENAKVYEDFVLKLETETGAAATGLISLCTTYYGDEDAYRAFVPGVTNPAGSNNFPLIYSDAGVDEVTAFWVRTKDFTALGLPSEILMEW